MEITIRHAIQADLDQLKSIADANRETLGFVLRRKIEDAIKQERVLIASSGDLLMGFVIYRHRKRDKQTTLSEICVHNAWRGQGVGKSLLEALIQECERLEREFIQLKCPENLSANEFYKQLGYQFIATEAGKKRNLIVWRKSITPS